MGIHEFKFVGLKRIRKNIQKIFETVTSSNKYINKSRRNMALIKSWFAYVESGEWKKK